MENVEQPFNISENSILKSSIPLNDSKTLVSTIHADVASVNTFPIYIALSLYILSKSFNSTTPFINIFKGKFRSISGLLLKIAVLCSCVYQFLLYFLNTKFNIDKITLELSQRFNETYLVTFKDYTIDLCYVLVTSLQISDVLLVSCIFLAISILSNVSSDLKEFQALNSLLSIRNYICIFSRLWGITRIPIYFYIYGLEKNIDERYVLFAKLLVSSLELGVASFFMFLTNIKNQRIRKAKFSAGLFTSGLLLYGFFKYVINFVDFPFKLTKNGLDLILSFQSIIQISIIIIVSDVFFSSFSTVESECAKSPGHLFNQVTELEAVIEFEESKRKLKPVK